jgi:hypothetical protein
VRNIQLEAAITRVESTETVGWKLAPLMKRRSVELMALILIVRLQLMWHDKTPPPAE